MVENVCPGEFVPLGGRKSPCVDFFSDGRKEVAKSPVGCPSLRVSSLTTYNPADFAPNPR